MGVFEPVDKVIETLRVEEGVFSMAISREFAIDKDMNFFYRSDRVGMFDDVKMKPIFLKSKAFLKELIDA